MEKRAIIFDFDGTLADVAQVVRELYNEEAPKRGWPELTDAQYKRLRRGTIKEAMQWVGIRSWQVPGLLRLGRSRFHERSQDVKLFEGIPQLINELYLKKWDIYVLSANSVITIHEVLERNKLSAMIKILKRPPVFGKAMSINRLISKKRYDRNNVWMVGDEVRDISAANKAGIKSVAVNWGLQDASLLKRNNPTVLVSKPHQIAAAVIEKEK